MGHSIDYIPKTTVKALSKRSDLWGAWLVIHCWGVIAISMALAIRWPLLIPIAIIIIGSRQHGLAILAHDCAHGVLFNNRRVNDFVGQYILSPSYGGDMESYRHYHLKHHRHTQTEDDPDLGLSSKFPITRDSLARKFIRDLTGQTFLRLQLAIYGAGKDHNIDGGDAFGYRSVWPILIVNAGLLIALTLAGYGWAYFVLWLLPVMTWFMVVLRVRNIAEHAMTTQDENPLTHARTTRASWFARAIFAPYYVNYHVEHHAYMFVPCYQLPALHRAMIAAGHGPDMEQKPHYRAVLSGVLTA